MKRRVLVLVFCVLGAISAATAGTARAADPPCGPAWTQTQLPVPAGWDDGYAYLGISAVSPIDIWAVGNAQRFATSGNPRFGEAITAHWDGSAWTLHVPPHPAGETQFDQLGGVAALPGGFAWAVGSSDAFATNGGAIIDHLASGAWTEGTGASLGVGGGGFATYDAIAAVSNSNVWVSATTSDNRHRFQHWNGSRWTSYTVPGETSSSTTISQILAIKAVSATNIWAVGDVSTQGAGEVTLIEHWNGTAWSISATPSSPDLRGLTDLYIGSASNIYAVGRDQTEPFQPVVLHYNGASWSSITVPNSSGAWADTVTATSPTDIWLLGQAASGFAYYAHYDGHAWTHIAPPAIGGVDIDTNDFHSATATQGQMWATGTGARTTASRLCPELVSATGFSQPSVSVPLGETPDFVFPASNAASHSVSDASPLHLFTGASVADGFSQTPYRFAFAGTYPLRDPTTAKTMTVKVAPLRSAPSLTHGQKVKIVWSATAGLSGDVFDAQVKRPGASTFTAWQTGVTVRSAQFTTTIAGTYQFRTRIRTTGGTAVAWSPVISVTAS